MNNENRKNKKLFIALIACAAAAAIAIIAVSVVLGVTASREALPVDDPGGIVQDDQTPDDQDQPDDQQPEDPDDQQPDLNEPDDPTSGELVYGAPLDAYELGQVCVTDELVWSNTLHWYSTHNGTDFHAEAGTPVMAIVAGEVTEVKYTTQEGYVVTVKGEDGYTAIYKSLSADTLVEAGDVVSVGTQLGYVSDSMTSEQSDGPHLHLEVLDESGAYIDPMTLLGETEK